MVRRLQGQEGDVVGEEEPATPKKIFQLLNQVIVQRKTYELLLRWSDQSLYASSVESCTYPYNLVMQPLGRMFYILMVFLMSNCSLFVDLCTFILGCGGPFTSLLA